MRVTIHLEAIMALGSAAPRKIVPTSLEVDGPVTPALLDELKAILQRIDAPPPASELEKVAADLRALRELGDGLRDDVAELTKLITRQVASS